MIYTKICKHCGKTFQTNRSQKLYCDGPHYRPCPVCGKDVLMDDNDFSRNPKCCSSKCTHTLRKSNFKQKKCAFCGKLFTPDTGVQIVCKDTHYRNCEICGESFVRTLESDANNVTTCSDRCLREKLRRRSQERYGTDHPMQSKAVQNNFHQSMKAKYGVEHALQIPGKVAQQQKKAYRTNMERNDVPYACLLPQCIEAQGNIMSHRNIEIANCLQDKGLDVSFERRLNNMSFDLCIESIKTLIEIDPSYTHSSVPNHWGTCRDRYYHRNKSQVAEDHGYRCIHIFDWDDVYKIMESLTNRIRIYARKCTVYRLLPNVANEFLSLYHFQGSCRGQLLYLGLVCDGVLYQVMTFGRPRYDSHHYVELLRLCTRPGYTVVGGASRLLSYATSEYGLTNIISYCDISKFTGSVYEQIGMKFLRTTPPQEIWCKGKDKITANLLRQRGYDQLFKTNYGKGSNNEELMIQNGWLPVYDCGQRVYEFL